MRRARASSLRHARPPRPSRGLGQPMRSLVPGRGWTRLVVAGGSEPSAPGQDADGTGGQDGEDDPGRRLRDPGGAAGAAANGTNTAAVRLSGQKNCPRSNFPLGRRAKKVAGPVRRAAVRKSGLFTLAAAVCTLSGRIVFAPGPANGHAGLGGRRPRRWPSPQGGCQTTQKCSENILGREILILF